MNAWQSFSLEDLIEVKHGFAFQGEYFRDEPPGDVLLTPGNFAIGGGFQIKKCKYYNGPVPEEFVLGPGDLLVTMTDLSKGGDTLGFPAVVPFDDKRYLHNQRLGKVLLKDGARTTLDYIQWVMRTEPYRNEVLASCTGSTVKHTSPSRILKYRFFLPGEDEQESIIAILGALDAKVDLNRRMNETLEAVARAVFRDWFVDFGPTYAKMEDRPPYLAGDLWSLFPDSFDDDGKPEGWRSGRLGDIAASTGQVVNPEGLAPDTPYIGLEHMPRRSVALDSWEGAEKVSSGKLSFGRGDFLFGKLRPYFHKVGIAPLDGICSTDIVVLRAKKASASAFVLACISSNEFVAYTDQTSGGTKMPRTSWELMARYELPLAPDTLMEAYQNLAAPLVERIVSNVHESRTLAQTRDLLLPKLMSGEIRVKDAENIMAEVA